MSAFVRAPGASPLVYGHRGMIGAPENTLPAFEKALAAGADGFELDVRLCGSGEVVVMHDPDLVRLVGRPERVAELAYAQLRTIDLGGATAPRLDEALDLGLGQGKRVNVEIKSDVPELEALTLAVAQVLAARAEGERERIVVSSFHPAALAGMHAHLPGLALAFLFANEKQEALAPVLEGGGVHPRFSCVDARRLAAFRERARFVNVWTVNDADEARRLATLGVDGIITDVPDVIRAALASRARA